MYVTLDGTRTFKALLQSIAAFLSVPDNEDMSELKLKRRITEYAKNCGTSLIMIDDIHYLDKRFVGVEGLNNELKKFMGVIPATFIYASIDCENRPPAKVIPSPPNQRCTTQPANAPATQTVAVDADTLPSIPETPSLPYSGT